MSHGRTSAGGKSIAVTLKQQTVELKVSTAMFRSAFSKYLSQKKRPSRATTDPGPQVFQGPVAPNRLANVSKNKTKKRSFYRLRFTRLQA